MPKRTLAQIQKQIAALEEEARQVRQREIAGVVDRIKEAIAHYSLTTADLGLTGRRGKATAAPKRKAKKARKATATKVKYRDEAGHTWSGRGRRPRWYLEAIAAGKTQEQLAA